MSRTASEPPSGPPPGPPPESPPESPPEPPRSRGRRRPIHRATASVPGKLILAGEHAVVYGRPALVAAVDRRLEATFAGPLEAGAEGPGIRLDAPALGPPREISWRRTIDHARAARQSWQRFARDPAGQPFPDEHRGEPAHVVLTALGEAAMFLGEDSGPPIALTLRGRLPIGRGFGSSAAAAVAVLAGYLALRNAPGDHHDLAHLALEVERRQHGLPSGVDAATVLHGGLVEARPRAEGGLELRPLAAASPRLERFAVHDTGRPPESTGEVVAAVRGRFDSSPALAEILDGIEQATRDLRTALGGSGDTTADETAAQHPGTRFPGTDPRTAIRACQRGLEELGVVPDGVAELVRRIEDAGGAAKISGAGSLRGPGAGILLVYHPDRETLADLPGLASLRRHPLRLGAAGLRLATPEDSAPGNSSPENGSPEDAPAEGPDAAP